MKLTKILRDKAAGKKNGVGDYWSNDWCRVAANRLEDKDGHIQELASALLDALATNLCIPKDEKDKYKELADRYLGNNDSN